MTDHKPLVNIQSIKPGHDPTGRRERWSIELSTYDFVLQYKQGTCNGNADGLSRLPVTEDEPNKFFTGRTAVGSVSAGQDGISAVSAAESSSYVAGPMLAKGDGENLSWSGDLEIKRFQSEDQNCKLMVEMKTGGDRKPLPAGYSPTLRSLWSQWSRIIVQDGVLYRRWEETEGQNSFLQVVVPRSLVNKVLEALHCHKTAGHLGFEKTLAKVRSRFYWYGYQKDTEIFCKKCDRCATGKSPPYTTKAPLQLDSPTYPWERIAMDIVGPLPKTDRNNRYILVISDYFTK